MGPSGSRVLVFLGPSTYAVQSRRRAGAEQGQSRCRAGAEQAQSRRSAGTEQALSRRRAGIEQAHSRHRAVQSRHRTGTEQVGLGS